MKKGLLVILLIILCASLTLGGTTNSTNKTTLVNETNNLLLQDEDQGNTNAPEETQVLNSIRMSDTILESQGMSNAVKFVIMALFLTIFGLFFIASHHKHESKLAGTHHPHKKKKK